MRPAGAGGGRDAEVSVFAHHRLHPLVLANIETVMLSDLAVILKRFFASGLLQRGRKRDVTNLEQFGSGKKSHACGIVEKRIDQTTFVEDDDFQADLLR